jgi:hypothetical protein
MCVSLINWDKGEIQIFSDTALMLCLSCRKTNHINPFGIIFELNNEIMQLSLDCLFDIFCQQEVSWFTTSFPKLNK